MKKKQLDFQKLKLRVGKQLPKGQNVTDTSFKTRKIITREQGKSGSSQVSLTDLLQNLSNNNVSAKRENLRKLNHYVAERKDVLSMYFQDILHKVGKALLEDDGSVREAAINVLHTCLKLLSEAQFKCSFLPFTSYLNCMMTHLRNTIRKDSLKLLDIIINTHPNVICYSVSILCSLMNMISSVVHEVSTVKGRRKRRLDEHISSNLSSQDWRIEVLSRMLFFIHAMLDDGLVEIDEDEKEVHWDGEKPLYLPLYRHSGLKPLKLETLLTDSKMDKKTSQDFKNFMYEVLPIISQVIKAEISCKQIQPSSSSHVIEPPVVKLLNIVTQVLCCLSEWAIKTPCFQKRQDPEFTQLLINVICRELLKYFPYVQYDSSIKKRSIKKAEMECMQLNLGICYLYCMIILDTKSASVEKEEAIMTYLKDLFRVCSKMCPKSIFIMLQISSVVVKSSNINESYKNAILLGLYGILEVHKSTPSADKIYSFFMDISLNQNNGYILSCDAMETWFKLTIKELAYMMDTGIINQNFLNYVKQICTRKYSYFMDLLNKIPTDEIIDLLKHDDEEFQVTIIYLIYSMDSISFQLFQALCETLSHPSFSVKTASKLIQLLQVRYQRPNVSMENKVNFVRFLLNLACDTTTLSDPSFLESTHSSHTLMEVLQSCHYHILPFEKWERNVKITEICISCLSPYLRKESFVNVSFLFLKNVVLDFTKYPVHSVIALFKLRNKIRYIYDFGDMEELFMELIFCSLIYLSVVLKTEIDDHAMYAVLELQKNLTLERSDIHNFVEIISTNISNFGESELYYTLRMILFLIKAKILIFSDRQLIFSVVEKVNSTCQRSSLLEPLWINILKFFHFV